MQRRTYSLWMVSKDLHSFIRVLADSPLEGISEQLIERVASSPAEPYLKGLRELFINYWGKQSPIVIQVAPEEFCVFPALESQAFYVKQPTSLFSFFSPPRSDAVFKAARDHIEEELRFTAKIVRFPLPSSLRSCYLVSGLMLLLL